MLKVFVNKKNKGIFLKKNKKVKIGLTFGGGGARGYAHLGVVKAFEEYGLEFDFVSGTSVGAMIGAFYANGWKFQEMYDMASKFKEKEIRRSKIPFMPSSTSGLEEIIKNGLGEMNIEDSKIPLAIIATDILSTQECVITNGDLARAVAGSCAVPAIFHPVEFEGKLLLDGGLQNTLPSDIPKIFGCDYVVAIDVHSARNNGAKTTKYFDVLGATMRVLMGKSAISGYKFAEVVLTPETKRFKSTKIEGFDEMIEEGYKEAIDKMPQVLALFNKKPKRGRKKIEKNAIFI